jgi:hypothetical protein
MSLGGSRRMGVNGWAFVNGRDRMHGMGGMDRIWWTLNESWRTLGEIVSDNNDDNDDVAEWSTSVSFATIMCRRENNFFFLLLFIFYFLKKNLLFFNKSYSLFFLSFVHRTGRDGNRKIIFEEMKKIKCLSIWSSFRKFARGTRTTKKLKHKRKRIIIIIMWT